MPKVSPSGGWIWSNHGKYNGFGSISCFGNFVFFVVSGTVLEVTFIDFGVRAGLQQEEDTK